MVYYITIIVYLLFIPFAENTPYVTYVTMLHVTKNQRYKQSIHAHTADI